MKLQRRDLFRAAVAGIVGKAVGPAAASRVADAAVSLKETFSASHVISAVDTINKVVAFSFDGLFTRDVQ